MRINIESGEWTTVIDVAGDVVGDAARELEQACHGASTGLILDLANVGSVDDAGLAVIRQLHDRGAEIRNSPPLVRLQLGIDL